MIFLRCDECGLEAPTMVTAEEAEDAALESGWDYRRGYWFCPFCGEGV